MKYTLTDIFQGDYPISQKYGERPEYYKQFGLAGHEGVDFATPVGVSILAPFDGVILRDNDDFKNNAYGNFIVIWDSTQQCALWFCHLSENNVKIGDSVKKGQVLGKTGNSGNSSGPHLHINFVTTDKNGNRLNMDNGYQGFLDILDTNLVEWAIGGSTPTPPSNSTNTSPLEAKASTYTNKLNQYKDQLDYTYYMDDWGRIVDDLVKYKSTQEVIKANYEKELDKKQELINKLSKQLQGLPADNPIQAKEIEALKVQLSDAQDKLLYYHTPIFEFVDTLLKVFKKH